MNFFKTPRREEDPPNRTTGWASGPAPLLAEGHAKQEPTQLPPDPDKPVRQVLHRHREQRSPGHSGTTGCACGWCPRERTKEEDPSLLQQYLQHVAEQLREIR